MEKFTPFRNCSLKEIIDLSDKYAFMFKLILVKPFLKSDAVEMPSLQMSKCVKYIDPVIDNGRILCAGYVEIYVTEIDAKIIQLQYDYEKHLCTEVEYARKARLPKWFRDYVYKCFVEKTTFKGGDPVLYALAKARLNSLYGMCCQHPVRPTIEQDYSTGEYLRQEDEDLEAVYEKYCKRITSILPYQWGVWVTAYAMENLFQLGACAGEWIYSDTDSVYGMEWDIEAVEKYNEQCKKDLISSGYGPVKHNGSDYWLGVAEHDPDSDVYTEYVTVGSKRYCGRSKSDGQLHITIAGVPKQKGVLCLKNDISMFTSGMVFDGATTGKKTHHYMHVDEIYTDEAGNLTGDSIDLQPCDYLLQSEYDFDWEKILYESIEVTNYEIL